MDNITRNDEKHKSTRGLFNEIFPPIPPDPLIEIADLVRSGFNYARRCLHSINRLRKENARLNRAVVDLQSRQEYLENLLIQRGN